MKSLGPFHCRRLFPASSWGGKEFLSFLRGFYGCRFGRTCKDYLRKCELIHPVLRLVLWCGFGVLLFPLNLFGEFSSSDSSSLLRIRTDVENIRSKQLESYLLDVDIRNDLRYFVQTFGFGNGTANFEWNFGLLRSYAFLSSEYLFSISNNTSTISQNVSHLSENSDSVLSKLDEIISALEALSSSGGGSSGDEGGSAETITQDWLKEDTFTAARAEDNAATQEYRDWFKSAFGFGGSSSTPSMYDFFTSDSKFYYPRLVWSSYYVPSPFPVAGGTGAKWVEDYNYMSETKTYPNQTFIERFSHVLAANLNQVIAANEHFAINGAWNDWYAHTNLVANLWAIHNAPLPTGEVPTIGFSQDGILTYKDGSSSEGSSAPTSQTLDLTPVATNSYNGVVADITEMTDAVTGGAHTSDNPIDTDAIRARYFAYLDIKGASTDIGDDIRSASSSGETLEIDFMGNKAELDLSSWGTAYRGVMTKDRLQTWRGAMGIIWLIASWVGGFFLVKRLGNME